jgi:hypothetical protein
MPTSNKKLWLACFIPTLKIRMRSIPFKYCLTVLTVLIFLSSCDELVWVSESSDEDFVKIYMNKYNTDVYAIDIEINDDGTVVLFGVTGSFMKTKFDGNGSLYIQKTDPEGEILWETVKQLGGDKSFPSNIIKTGPNTYATIWNEKKFIFIEDHWYIGHQRVDITIENEGAKIDTTKLVSPLSIDYIPYLSEAVTPSGGYCVLAMGKVTIEGSIYRRLYILQTNSDFSSIKEISSYDYDPLALTGYLDNDKAFLELVDPYLYLGHDENNYQFYGPVKNKMVLMHAGDYLPIYEDQKFWISDIQYLENNVNCLIKDRTISGGETYLVNELDLFPRESVMETVNPVQLPSAMNILDPDKRVFLLDDYIAGTLLSQKIIVLHDGVPLELGSNYPYEVGGIAKTPDDILLVAGTTRLQYKSQRLFLIKTSLK